jgi:hypothetical protein
MFSPFCYPVLRSEGVSLAHTLMMTSTVALRRTGGGHIMKKRPCGTEWAVDQTLSSPPEAADHVIFGIQNDANL